jgi:hypothetical protein
MHDDLTVVLLTGDLALGLVRISAYFFIGNIRLFFCANQSSPGFGNGA